MVNSRRIDKHKFLLVFIMTTLIFVVGMFVGDYFSSKKLSTVEEMEQDMKIETMAIELQYELLSEDPCSSVNSTPLTDKLYDLSRKLDYMENVLGPENPSVRGLKEYYFLLEIQHYLFLKKIKKECEGDYDFILYFYSNKGDCPTCEEQGYALSYMRKINENVRIYPFDINIENIALETIQDQFNMKKENGLPILVINGVTHYGFKNSDKLISLTEQKNTT